MTHDDIDAFIFNGVKDSDSHFIVISIILFGGLKNDVHQNPDPIKLSFSCKLNWKLLYSLSEQCIVLIKIFPWCTVFTGLCLYINNYNENFCIILENKT